MGAGRHSRQSPIKILGLHSCLNDEIAYTSVMEFKHLLWFDAWSASKHFLDLNQHRILTAHVKVSSYRPLATAESVVHQLCR